MSKTPEFSVFAEKSCQEKSADTESFSRLFFLKNFKQRYAEWLQNEFEFFWIDERKNSRRIMAGNTVL
jgi:hypothetical protein